MVKCYRHAPVHMQKEVVEAFEGVKKYIKLMFIRDLLDMKSTKEIKNEWINNPSANLLKR